MKPRSSHLFLLAIALLSLRPGLCAAADAGHATTQADQATTRPGNTLARDYYLARYRDYKPAFLSLPGHWLWSPGRSDERSSEKNFDNLSVLNEDSRVDAAITVAQQREQNGDYRDAIPLYQEIVEKSPDVLYRVSANGVFVRAADYCQMRLLAMPPADLAFYRTQYDARAAEAFAEAERQCSMAGYQEIVDNMLATSWGGKAMMSLGRAALDAGRYQEAYQRFAFVQDFFNDGHCDSDQLAVLLAYAARKCGKSSPLSITSTTIPQGLAQMKAALPNVSAVPAHIPLRCAPYACGGDYTPFPVPLTSPLFGTPVWKSPLPTEWYTKEVYSTPVVTEDSLLIRHRNVVYCYSLLTGLLRWKNDMGGRVNWQNPWTLSVPTEELVVSDNMVYTNMFKGGPSLVALSLTTGELRWAAGPMASSAEVHIRYEAAPVVDGGVVYAGYIHDNIEGDTHFDTVYGLRAFDAKTGQLLWDRQLSRLPTGKFTTNVGDVMRIKIRSFCSPPTIKEGTLYYNTNAGTVAAVEARTGRVQWLARYPYFILRGPIHDATESVQPFIFRNGLGYGSESLDNHPSLWSNQPPLIYNDCLYIAPVDSGALMCIELSTGKVRWSHLRGIDDPKIWTGRSFLGPAHLVGPTKTGELIVVYGTRYRAATALNAATGKVDWQVGDVIPPETSPALTEPSINQGGVLDRTMEINRAQFSVAARPTLLADDTLVFSSFGYFVFGLGVSRSFVYSTATVSIPDHKVIKQERYYDAGILNSAETIIHDDAPAQLKFCEGDKIERCKRIMADHAPDNPAGPFKPAAILTAERFGTVFEIRVASDEVAVVYDKARVEQSLAANDTAPGLLARAELALAKSAYSDAATLLNQCLAKTLPEQIAFREKIAGLFHSLDLHLSRKAVLRRDYKECLANASLLLETSQSLPQEIQSLLAVAESYAAAGDAVRAARVLRNVIEHYGAREFSVSPLIFRSDASHDLAAVLDQVANQTPARLYGPEFSTGLSLAKNSTPLYTSVLSPAESTLTTNVGTLALARLLELARTRPEVASMLDQESGETFAKAEAGEREGLLRCFPHTAAGQKALDELATAAKELGGVDGRRQAWRLADTAEAAGYALPDVLKESRPFAPKTVPVKAILPSTNPLEVAFQGGEILRLALPRSDASLDKRELLFVGGRAQKRLDNKFTLECYNTHDGKRLWTTSDLRLKGVGQEAGFFEAFVHRQMVIVHGLFDVLAFDVADGHLLWRYRVPAEFEIAHALLAGDLLVLTGDHGTLGLYAPTTSEVGDVVWESREEGALYDQPYVAEDRLVMIRQSPNNVTVRRLGSGQLVGRMDLPGLASSTLHPLLAAGAEALPIAHAGNLLLLTDGWNYLLIDTKSLSLRWQREIDSNDPAVVPPMRITLNDRVAVITKKDYDHGAMYGIDLGTGDVRWKTEPKDSRGLPALYDVFLDGDVACGLTVPAKQSFRVVAFEPSSGQKLAEWKANGYGGDPLVRLESAGDEQNVLLTVLQGQKLQVQAVDIKATHLAASLEREGVGPFGTHGCASAGTFDGRMVLLTKNGFSVIAGP